MQTIGSKAVNFTNEKAAKTGIALNPAFIVESTGTNTLSMADLKLISNIDNLLLSLRDVQDFE